MDEGKNFLGLVLLAFTLLSTATLVSSSYVTFAPVLYHVAEPRIGEFHLNSTFPHFSYYVYNFSLVSNQLKIENLITHELAKFNVSSNSIIIITVSNTSLVYVYYENTLLELVLSPNNVSFHKEFKVSGENTPWYVQGWILSSNDHCATWVGFKTIEIKNGSDEYLLFTPSGRVMQFKANVTYFYKSGKLLLFDLANGSSLLLGVGSVVLKGLLEFPYLFKGEVIFYNSTSSYVEEYSPTQGGQSLSTVQQPVSKVEEIRHASELLYLGSVVFISVSGQEPTTLVYSMSDWSLLANVTGQVTEVVYNISSTYLLFGDHKTTLLSARFNVPDVIPNSVTYCVNGYVVVESVTENSLSEVYIPTTNQSFLLQGIDAAKQPIPLGQGLLAFPEAMGEGGLTWLWVVSLKNQSRFQVLAFYSNTTYQFDDIYYFYNGTIYTPANGTLVSVTIVNASGYVEISGGNIDVKLRAGNYSIILPNGSYVLTYNNTTEVLTLSGEAVHVDLGALLKANSTSTARAASSNLSAANSTFTSSLETVPPLVGVTAPPEQAGTLPRTSPAEIALIILGYISIIGIYLYRRKR